MREGEARRPLCHCPASLGTATDSAACTAAAQDAQVPSDASAGESHVPWKGSHEIRVLADPEQDLCCTLVQLGSMQRGAKPDCEAWPHPLGTNSNSDSQRCRTYFWSWELEVYLDHGISVGHAFFTFCC